MWDTKVEKEEENEKGKREYHIIPGMVSSQRRSRRVIGSKQQKKPRSILVSEENHKPCRCWKGEAGKAECLRLFPKNK